MEPLLAAAALAASAAPPAVAIPPQPALTREIEARDAELFRLVFETCDPQALRAMLAPDIEFYHDKGGVIRSADAFLDDYRKTCDSWKAPNAWRSRRALVRASLHVDPVPGYGAIEAGEHLFYERQGNGPEKLVGRATSPSSGCAVPTAPRACPASSVTATRRRGKGRRAGRRGHLGRPSM